MIKFMCVLLVLVAIIHVTRSQGFGDGPGGRIGGPTVGGKPHGPAVGGTPGGLLGVEGRPGGSPTVGGRPGGPAVGGRPGGLFGVEGRPGGLLGVGGRPGGLLGVGGRPGGPAAVGGTPGGLGGGPSSLAGAQGGFGGGRQLRSADSRDRLRRHGGDLSGRRPAERPGAIGCARGCPSNDGRLGESSQTRGRGEIEING